MREIYTSTFDFFSDWVHEVKTAVMVTEPKDIEQALEVALDVQKMLERGLIDDRKFLHDYTTIDDDNNYCMLNNVDFPIELSVVSIIKYGAKHLIELLIGMLNENKDAKISRMLIEPK